MADISPAGDIILTLSPSLNLYNVESLLLIFIQARGVKDLSLEALLLLEPLPNP